MNRRRFLNGLATVASFRPRSLWWSVGHCESYRINATHELLVLLSDPEALRKLRTNNKDNIRFSISEVLPKAVRDISAFSSIVGERCISEQTRRTLEKLSEQAYTESACYRDEAQASNGALRDFNYFCVQGEEKLLAEFQRYLLSRNNAAGKPLAAEAVLLGDPVVTEVAAGIRLKRSLAGQGHLWPGPMGVNAMDVFGEEGATGEDVRITDIEIGWNLEHHDFENTKIDEACCTADALPVSNHGTNVLGILAGQRYSPCSGGITPDCTVCLCPIDGSIPSILDSLARSLDASARFPGSILLLEIELRRGPVEIDPMLYKAIRLASALNVVVIEPGSNNGVDLDSVEIEGNFVLNPDQPEFNDSGTIMIGAGFNPDVGKIQNQLSCDGDSSRASDAVRYDSIRWSRFRGSGQGKRLNCFAWGHHIQTTTCRTAGGACIPGYDTFGGVSGASAIIAGAAVSIQGICKKWFGVQENRDYFKPEEIRMILSNPETGTTAIGQKMGVMPDLGKIVSLMKSAGTKDRNRAKFIQEVTRQVAGTQAEWTSRRCKEA